MTKFWLRVTLKMLRKGVCGLGGSTIREVIIVASHISLLWGMIGIIAGIPFAVVTIYLVWEKRHAVPKRHSPTSPRPNRRRILRFPSRYARWVRRAQTAQSFAPRSRSTRYPQRHRAKHNRVVQFSDPHSHAGH